MQWIILACLVLLTASLSRADVFIENYDSYNPPQGGSVDLVRQGGWLEADGLGGTGTGNTNMTVSAGTGLGGTNGFTVGSTTESAAMIVRELLSGDLFKFNNGGTFVGP